MCPIATGWSRVASVATHEHGPFAALAKQCRQRQPATRLRFPQHDARLRRDSRDQVTPAFRWLSEVDDDLDALFLDAERRDLREAVGPTRRTTPSSAWSPPSASMSARCPVRTFTASVESRSVTTSSLPGSPISSSGVPDATMPSLSASTCRTLPLTGELTVTHSQSARRSALLPGAIKRAFACSSSDSLTRSPATASSTAASAVRARRRADSRSFCEIVRRLASGPRNASVP